MYSSINSIIIFIIFYSVIKTFNSITKYIFVLYFLLKIKEILFILY